MSYEEFISFEEAKSRLEQRRIIRFLESDPMRQTIQELVATFRGSNPFSWREVVPAFLGTTTLFETIEAAMVAGAAAKQAENPGAPPVTRTDLENSYKNMTYQEARAKFLEFLVSMEIPVMYENKEDNEGILVGANAGVVVKANMGATGMSITLATQSDVIPRAFRVWAEEFLTQQVTAGTVYVLVASSSGLEFQRLGSGGEALNRDNYSDEVLEAYDRIKTELTTKRPYGRLSILQGDPGSGKTFLIRGLLQDIADKCTMVLVPATLVEQLAGPSGIGSIMGFRARHSDEPLVFLLEDADAVLTPRDAYNMSLVSSVLNMTDGIVGATMDIRIVATTNATQMELDPAVKRPGRLSVLQNVGKLSAERADKVLKRLTDGGMTATREMSLAEIYQTAYDAGFKAVKSKERRMGFGA